jgi:hypothetical protein
MDATLASTPTPTPLTLANSIDLPTARVQILQPGPGSRVVSPFLTRAYLEPGHRGMVRIELLGEDGRLLMRELKRFSTQPGVKVFAAVTVAFEIPAVAEAGYVQVSVDDEYGRAVALSSTDVLLFTHGSAEITPQGDARERIVITEPMPNARLEGGTIWVAGIARPRTTKPLLIELITEDGRIVGSRQINVVPTFDDGYGPFAIDVPYRVYTSTPVLIIVRERGENFTGITHLSSMEVFLDP